VRKVNNWSLGKINNRGIVKNLTLKRFIIFTLRDVCIVVVVVVVVVIIIIIIIIIR